jgi:hypothetical protein
MVPLGWNMRHAHVKPGASGAACHLSPKQPHLPSSGLPEAGEHLDQFVLTVAGHADHAQDLPLVQGKRDVPQRWLATVVLRPEMIHRQDWRSEDSLTLRAIQFYLAPDHQPGEGICQSVGRHERCASSG